MHKPKKRNLRSPQKSVEWLEDISDCLPGLVIPVGPRFQADVAEWTGLSNEGRYLNGDVNTSKWLGSRTWPLQDGITITTGGGEIGRGRPDSCSCSYPGSSPCIHRHVSEERGRLQSDLGPAFKSWKFDEMGVDVSKSWTSKQRDKFDDLMMMTNPVSRGKSLLMSVESSFPSKNWKDIVSYYLNVYVPKRISMRTRSGCQVLDSDDDEAEEAHNGKNSLKRCRPVDNTMLAKSHYLTGRR